MHLEEYENALADYNEALHLRPDYPDAYFNLACLHSLRKHIRLCLANLERAIGLDGKHREMGLADPDLEWARQDERVRKLLGLT